MNDLKNLRFECTRCGNCCTDKDTLVNLTYLDIIRIKKGLKLELKEILNLIGFYIYENKITNDDKEKMVIEPIETEKGLAFIALRKSSLGGCYFYNSTQKKCLIYNLRPMLCRTFPFTFGILNEKSNEDKNKIDLFYTEKGKHYCPGISDEAPLISVQKWKNLGQITLEELEKNYKVIKEWNDMVKIGKIMPLAKKFLLTIFKLDDS